MIPNTHAELRCVFADTITPNNVCAQSLLLTLCTSGLRAMAPELHDVAKCHVVAADRESARLLVSIRKMKTENPEIPLVSAMGISFLIRHLATEGAHIVPASLTPITGVSIRGKQLQPHGYIICMPTARDSILAHTAKLIADQYVDGCANDPEFSHSTSDWAHPSMYFMVTETHGVRRITLCVRVDPQRRLRAAEKHSDRFAPIRNFVNAIGVVDVRNQLMRSDQNDHDRGVFLFVELRTVPLSAVAIAAEASACSIDDSRARIYLGKRADGKCCTLRVTFPVCADDNAYIQKLTSKRQTSRFMPY